MPLNDKTDKARVAEAAIVARINANFNPVALTELMRIVATEHKIRYDAFLAAGFSAEQSLFLCRGGK